MLASSCELLLSFMTADRSAIAAPAVSPLSSGIVFAALGVLSFSLSFPGTVWALDGFGPWSATGVRGVLAAVIALSALLATRASRPARADWPALAVVAGGCAIGFPLLTTLALQTSSTAHSAVVIGALPMATATISALLTQRHPSKMFWAAAGTGAVVVIAFTLSQHHGQPTVADLYLFGALLVCAAGYAQGGRLSAHMPGWRVIAWGIVLAAPVNLAVSAWALPHEPLHLTAKAVVGMAYIAGISQFGGFVVWYKGMGLIGVARASQLQLAQPLLTLAWAVLLLGEHVSAAVPLTAVVVLACIVVTQRTRAS
jgi:drug/metabolite transporter (DMT)-like permease